MRLCVLEEPMIGELFIDTVCSLFVYSTLRVSRPKVDNNMPVVSTDDTGVLIRVRL